MYKKIVLKLSGESLKGTNGLDFNKALKLAGDLKQVYDAGVRLLLVIGGGNFWRGREHTFMESDSSDYVGMLATEMNAIILGEALKQAGVKVKVYLRFPVPIAEAYNEENLKRDIEDNFIVLGGGVGKPGFSTDTGSAIAASVIKADLLIKMSKTDGVYDKDPFKYPDAKKIPKLTFKEAISQNLGIMDREAFQICDEAKVKILVTKMDKITELMKIDDLEKNGSLIF